MLRLPSLFVALTFACPGCHDEGKAYRPTDAVDRNTHVAYFPIQDGSAHAVADCNDCHGAFATFKQFDCLAVCHVPPGHPKALTDTEHVNVIGYVYDNLSCLACHPNSIRDINQGTD